MRATQAEYDKSDYSLPEILQFLRKLSFYPVLKLNRFVLSVTLKISLVITSSRRYSVWNSVSSLDRTFCFVQNFVDLYELFLCDLYLRAYNAISIYRGGICGIIFANGKALPV